MSWSSIAASILKSSEVLAPKFDSIVRADELMKLIASPTSIATLVLIGFARTQLDKNATASYDHGRTGYALVAAVAALALTTVIVAVMIPLSIRVIFTNRGGIETTLLVYVLMHLVAVGTAAYAGKVCHECVRELRFDRGTD